MSPATHATVTLDHDGWYTTNKLIVSVNITLLPLPLRWPEFNPMHYVWKFFRENRPSYRDFKSCDEIVARCCNAWNNLIDLPWRNTSVGHREWACGF